MTNSPNGTSISQDSVVHPFVTLQRPVVPSVVNRWFDIFERDEHIIATDGQQGAVVGVVVGNSVVTIETVGVGRMDLGCMDELDVAGGSREASSSQTLL